jgi:quercetin dioxygenase-like cupin family protein
MSDKKVKVFAWNDIPLETMGVGISRRFAHSGRLMIAQVSFPKGKIVPAHRHDNEQATYMITGRLRFLFGDDQQEEIIIGPGEILFIPGKLLHSAEALDDVFELDIFDPPRADWIDGSDAYLRG